jgi:hypothetical protein
MTASLCTRAELSASTLTGKRHTELCSKDCVDLRERMSADFRQFRKYPSGERLVPESDSAAYGRFEQVCSMEQSHFAAAAETIGTELYIKAYVFLTNSTQSQTTRPLTDATG